MTVERLAKKSILVLISGKAGVGKSTLAGLIYDDLKSKNLKAVARASFAQRLKDVAKSMGWDGKKDEKGRKLLQHLGAVGREYDQDMWVKGLFRGLESHPYYPLNCVLVDDWRFPNELDFSKLQPLYKVITIRVESPERELLKGTEAENDVSETSLPSWSNSIKEIKTTDGTYTDPYYDIGVVNAGDLDRLNETAKHISDFILKEDNFITWKI